MKTTIISLCGALCIALGTSSPALADNGHDRSYYRPVPRQYGHGDYRPAPPRYDHDHRRGYGWAGPAALLAITGIAAGIAASTYYAPAPAYVSPQPAYVAPAAGYWNYCGSAGQYYPNVDYCPEGWQPVPAR
ncbi:MAG: hypothetical protein WBJ68_06225 [Candidatus Dechloromonas phosphoritropha]|jgi:hypothetical protein|nr:hypothetical protein [Candidatus Dechloromonas phosphoritropha]MBP8786258.1 hypothetical protein [Azonexus sp.]MBP9227196.1 hypothetical protein [Azonexus sp.]